MRDNLYVFFTILYVASFLISAVSYISCHVQKRKWSTTLFKSYSQKMDGMIKTIRRAGLDAQIAMVSDAGIFIGTLGIAILSDNLLAKIVFIVAAIIFLIEFFVERERVKGLKEIYLELKRQSR